MTEKPEHYALVKHEGNKSYAVARLIQDKVAEPCDPSLKPFIGMTLKELKNEAGLSAVHRWTRPTPKPPKG